MATIDATVRKHLQLPKDAPLPEIYVVVLQKFLKAYPDDINFTIQRTTSGYAVLKCLEEGCEGVQLNLGRLPGQTAAGIATLEPYKQHIRAHPTHATSRNNRIKRKTGTSMDMRGSIAPGRLIAVLDDAYARQPSLGPPRPRVSDPLIRKRTSDPVCIELSDSETELPPAKRPRVDSSLMQPLGDRNTPRRSLDPEMKPINQYSLPPIVLPSYNHPNIGRVIEAHPYIVDRAANPVIGHQGHPIFPMQAPNFDWLYEGDGNSDDGPLASDLEYPEDYLQLQRIGIPAISRPTSGFNSRDSEDDLILSSHQPGNAPRAQLDDHRIKNFLEHYHQESFGGQKTVQDGLTALNLPELGANIPGMQTALLAHQVIGVAWMLQREKENAKWARGGILADAMGLGKTVQSIGAICANPSTDPNCAATLIVAPLALLEQWRQEINWKCDEGTFNVLIYHGPNRPKHKDEIMKYDIVLTTYHTLGNEWPETEKKAKKGKKTADEEFIDDDDAEDRTTKKKRKIGPLMDIHWYRVILDEAQFIRNPRTKASSVVTHLIADIKWCLTGTPFTNSLKDAFGFFRFIEHNPFADWDRFKGLIRAYDEETAARNVQQALAGVLFRRTKESMLDGKPIITLPPRNETWQVLEFQPEERQIYDFVERKLQAVFNRFLQAGTVLKNYSQLLVLLMRLRQICVHPCLLKAYETAFEVTDTRDENDKKVIEEAARLVSNEFVALVKKNLRQIALERIHNEKLKGDDATVEDNCSICFEPFNGDTVITAPCAHSFCRVCIEAHINRPRGEADSKYQDHERDCPLCRQTISSNLLFSRRAFEPTDAELDINHSNDHVDSFSWEVDESGQGRYKAKMQKRKAKKRIVDTYSDLEDFIVDDDEEDGHATYNSRAKRVQQPNNRKASRVVISDDEEEEKDKEKLGKSIRKEADEVYEVSSSESDDELDALARRKSLAIQRAKAKEVKKSKSITVIDSDEDEAASGSGSSGSNSKKPFDHMDRPEMMSSFLPSTKMLYMMKYLEDVENEHPDDKTMVVSQWTSALDLCSDYLSERGIRYVRYQGNMSARERSEAINTFMTKGSRKVMLMSVKCGGVGLNITRACRVISLDPSWNAATDQQCFDRVHRLGQTKEVFIERLMIDNTVETRVREIQDRKQGLSDAALGEGKCHRVRFTVGELARLFGLR